MSSELSTGKTIIILAVVIGCFAVLWPKVFHPMLTSTGKPSTVQVATFRDAANAHFLSQLCFLVREHNAAHNPLRTIGSDQDCVLQVGTACKQTITENTLQNYRLLKDKTTLTRCLMQEFNLSPEKVMAAVPPAVKSKPYTPNVPHPHTRPERPTHLHPDTVHPALKEKGRMLPQRTIDKQARPGPMPGMRPPLGGGGHMVPPQSKGTGTMGLIMPIYTVGIVIFFVYTIMKVLFKKGSDEDKTAKLKSFNLDPEYRKYIFAEEYLDSSNNSHRDMIRRHERETSKHRRRHEAYPDPKIEDEQMDQLRRRLEETESAMERLMSQMGSVTDKLTAAKITEVLTQAQTQAKILKDSDDVTEGFTTSFTDEFSLPPVLQKRLEELHLKDMCAKGTSVDDQLTEDIEYDPRRIQVADSEPDMEKLNKDLNEHEDPDLVEGLSDMAQAGSDSNDDRNSEASETGADISDLNTFADGAPSPMPLSEPMPVIEDYTPEVNFMSGTGVVSDARRKLLEEDTMYGRHVFAMSGKEQATQTEAAKKLSVLDLQTTYQLKQQAESGDDSSNKIHEFLLDATVPADTQLLVQQAQMGSQPAENIEMDSTDNESRPCVVTSQVSLAFVGLEQNGRSDSPMMIIKPEQLGLTGHGEETAEVCHDIEIPIPIQAPTNQKNQISTTDGRENDAKESQITHDKGENELDHTSTEINASEVKPTEETQLTNKDDPSNLDEKATNREQVTSKETETEAANSDPTSIHVSNTEENKLTVKNVEDTKQESSANDLVRLNEEPVSVPTSKPSVTKINFDDYGSEEDASDEDSDGPQKIMRSKTNPNEVLQIIERPGQPRTYRKVIYVDESDPEEEIEAVRNVPSPDLLKEDIKNKRPISPRLELLSQPQRPDSPVPPFFPGEDPSNLASSSRAGILDASNTNCGKEGVELLEAFPQQAPETPSGEEGADLTKVSHDEKASKNMEITKHGSHNAENS